MTEVKTLGEWVSLKFEDQGELAAKLKPPVAKNTVSSWVTGRNRVKPKYRKQLEAMGFRGTYPDAIEREAPAAEDGPYVTEKDFAEWRGWWKKGEADVLARLKDLDRRLLAIERKLGISE